MCSFACWQIANSKINRELFPPMQITIVDSSCQALVSLNYHLPCQDAPHAQSLELDSMRTGGHPDRWADIQSAQLHSGNNFFKRLVSLKFSPSTCHLSTKSGVGVYQIRGVILTTLPKPFPTITTPSSVV